jgi:hypothetical protein
MKYPFQDGVDEAVVSLKNDLLKARSSCKVTSPNLIPNADAMYDTSGSVVAGSGWFVDGCPKTPEGNKIRCLAVEPWPGETVNGKTVSFAKLDYSMKGCAGIACATGEAGCTEAGCDGTQLSPRLVTRLQLEPGWYEFSYFDATGWVGHCDGVKPRVRNKDGNLLGTDQWKQVVFANGSDAALASGFGSERNYWVTKDRWRLFVAQSGEYELAFEEDTPGYCYASGGWQQDKYIGGAMLEKMSESDWLDTLSTLNVSYMGSDRQGKVDAPICEDTTGTTFRLEKWSERKCVRLCSNGYNESCDERSGQLECYREARFSIDESRIEDGKLFQSAGFAKGNFNYRIEQIGVNFVGTGLKNCADSSTADSCYANGSVQYTLEHVGPFFVRNHMGNDFEALVFDGRIEHARGLATERYLTNPLSSTDRGLIDQWSTRERGVRSKGLGVPGGHF